MANQFGDQRRHPIVFTVCPLVFDRDVFALNIAYLLEAMMECGH